MKFFYLTMLGICTLFYADFSTASANCAAITNPNEQFKCFYQSQNNQQYVAPPKPLALKCGENVDCSSHSNVISKMESAFGLLYNTNNPQASAYKDVCFEALQNVKTFPPHLQGKPAVYQSQLGACNAGLRYFKQQ
jgi:hypothetical protein